MSIFSTGKHKKNKEVRYIRECHECGEISISCDEDDQRETCLFCGAPLCNYGAIPSDNNFWNWINNHYQELYFQYIKSHAEREEKYTSRMKKTQQDIQRMKNEMEELNRIAEQERLAHMPHCPTCGSADLRRPRFLEGGYQTLSFVCNNCGYKW